MYMHNSIANITQRRQDLESDLVECIWLELKPNMNARIVCLFFIFLFYLFFIRNSSVSHERFDDFVHMIDNIHTAKLHAGIWLLLGAFKIDLLKLSDMNARICLCVLFHKKHFCFL